MMTNFFLSLLMQIKMAGKCDNCYICGDTATSWQVLCGLLIVMELETFKGDIHNH